MINDSDLPHLFLEKLFVQYFSLGFNVLTVLSKLTNSFAQFVFGSIFAKWTENVHGYV